VSLAGAGRAGGVGQIAKEAGREACVTPVPSASFPVDNGGLVWGRGRATPVPTCDAHTHLELASYSACRAGAGPREWLWFHLPPFGGRRLTTASGLARRQPPGLSAGHRNVPANLADISVDGSAPIGDACDCNARHRFVKPPTWDRNIELLVCLPRCDGSASMADSRTAATRSHSRERRSPRAPGISRCGADPPARPGRPPFRAPPSPRVRPPTRGGAPPGPTVPARSEETPRT
jgi:hypothetical protein